MKKQIEITDDIIRNKFDEILSGKDIEQQQIMGFNNIDKVKRYEFLRENFVQEVKNTIGEDGVSDNHLFSYFCDIVYNDIFKIAKDPVTVIYEAITKNDINLVETLLTNLEVNPNAEFNKYSTLLEVACTENNKDIVKLLLEKGADPILLFYKHVKSESAEYMGFNNIDDYFKAKAAINDSLISAEEKSVLSAKIKRHEFLREDFIKESKAFIEDPNINIRHVYKEAYNNTCTIAVMPEEVIVKAIQQGDYDLVNTLLTALNVDPNTYASTLEQDFGSLLYFACKNNQKKIAGLLLEKGAYINPPVQRVIQAGNLDMLEFLLENGADPNYSEGKIFSCLETAV